MEVPEGMQGAIGYCWMGKKYARTSEKGHVKSLYIEEYKQKKEKEFKDLH